MLPALQERPAQEGLLHALLTEFWLQDAGKPVIEFIASVKNVVSATVRAWIGTASDNKEAIVMIAEI